MDDHEPFVWVCGTLCRASEARLSPFDHGLLTGDGVFETMRVYRGQVFALRRHLERLHRSTAGLGLRPPADDVVVEACGAVIAANHLEEARVRVTVTAGPSPLGSERGEAPPTVVVAGSHISPWPPTVDVTVVPWTRNERGALAGLKTISYAENVVALAEARRVGAGEAIFANTVGNLCEGTGTNVFLVVDGRLITPPLAAGCLAGVTRDLLLEHGIGVEADVPVGRLAEAGEAFLTSSTREVQAIRAVDGVPLPRCPGPQTAAAKEAFAAILADGLDP